MPDVFLVLISESLISEEVTHSVPRPLQTLRFHCDDPAALRLYGCRVNKNPDLASYKGDISTVSSFYNSSSFILFTSRWMSHM